MFLKEQAVYVGSASEAAPESIQVSRSVSVSVPESIPEIFSMVASVLVHLVRKFLLSKKPNFLSFHRLLRPKSWLGGPK
jgi:hypothetical protein